MLTDRKLLLGRCMVNLINKTDQETGALICNRWCINGICVNKVERFIDKVGYCRQCAEEVEQDRRIRKARKKLYR